MTDQPKSHLSTSQVPIAWSPGAAAAFTGMCQSEGLNPVRLRKLIDTYLDTKRKPSRQELIDALKHKPRIQDRAAVLSSITKKLNAFVETLV